jgi:hypothetical protein
MHKKLKQFILKVLLLGFITLGTVELLYRFNPFQERDLQTSYDATIIDKYSRLQQLKSPKIVLIAGSNFAYGINSEMIEKAFNRPVVNMAMHYDYGTDFMLRQIENELHSSDIVVMGFEYMIDSEGSIPEKIKMAQIFPKANDWFEYKNLLEYLAENGKLRISNLRLTLERLSQKKIETPTVDDTTSIFFRKGCNKYGDLISHLNNPPVNPIPYAIIDQTQDLQKPIADMNVFYEKMKAKGVQVLYSYPSYAESSYKDKPQIINKLREDFQETAKFPLLGKPLDFVFADSLCQDMAYHLNVKGRDIRTQKLITFLKPYVK